MNKRKKISTMPYSSIWYCFASRSNSGRGTNSNAPRTEPIGLAIPPITFIITRFTGTQKP